MPVMNIREQARRLVFGAPQKTSRALKAALPKRKALPLFGSDGLSSVAYAPDEIVMMLAVAGAAGVAISPWVALLTAVVLLIVVGTYRFNISEISAQGDYELVTQRLGAVSGVVVAASTMVDFMLTVAVSAASASSYIVSLFPDGEVIDRWVALGVVLAMTLLALRGVRFLGKVAHIPWYGFLGVITALIITGLFQERFGTLRQAESASYFLLPSSNIESMMTGLGLAILVARAFSSGAVAMSGVSTLSNAARFLAVPRAKNAARTLMMMGGISSIALIAITYLVQRTGAVVVSNPREDMLLSNGRFPGEEFHQKPLLFQLADTIFGYHPLTILLVVVTVGVLLIASVTAFTGFPITTSKLAHHKYLPMQLNARGSRYIFANSVLILGFSAMLLVLIFDANVNALIQMYIVGVFTSMTLTQAAILHSRWKKLRITLERMKRRKLIRKFAMSCLGLAATGLALLIIVVTKMTEGAWVTVVLILLLVGAMIKVRRHYDRVDQELDLDLNSPSAEEARALPSRVHALIFVANVRKPVARAVAYARAARPSSIEAVAINIDESHTRELAENWEKLNVPVPFTIVDSPYRDRVTPFIEYVRSKLEGAPRDVVVVYLPEYVVDKAWERIFHRRTVHKLHAALRKEPGVVIATVPWQLGTDKKVMAEVNTGEEITVDVPLTTSENN